MADFFDDLGKRISDAASDLGKKTGDTIEIQKIKGDIRSLKRASDRDLMGVGRMIYEKFKKGEVSDEECIALCTEIEKREEEIGKQEEKITRIREDK